MNNLQKKETEIASSFFSLTGNAAVSISFWQTLSLPFKLFVNNLKSFLITAVPAAILLSACSLLFKHGMPCSLQSDLLATFPFCNDSVDYFYGDIIGRFLILILFCLKWYQIALLKMRPSLTLTAKNLKAFALMCLIMLINLLPLIAFLLLFMRQPNPDWKIEMAYFTAVAWMFVVPLLAVRFYSLLAFALEGETLPTLRNTWKNTSGNTLKLLLSIATILFLALFFFMQYSGSVMRLDNIDTFRFIAAEFEYNIMVTVFVALCINYCYVQKQLLFRGEKNEQ